MCMLNDDTISIERAELELIHFFEDASELQIARLYEFVFGKKVTFTGVKFMTESEENEMICEEEGLL
jgi:hypothetical protein